MEIDEADDGCWMESIANISVGVKLKRVDVVMIAVMCATVLTRMRMKSATPNIFPACRLHFLRWTLPPAAYAHENEESNAQFYSGPVVIKFCGGCCHLLCMLLPPLGIEMGRSQLWPPLGLDIGSRHGDSDSNRNIGRNVTH